MHNPIKAYLKQVEKELSRGDATEHTHRPACKTLIEALIPDSTATNEPKRIACGAPDFIVTKGQITLGFIEAKDVGKNLNAVEKTEQLKRYFDGLPNLILTDYLEFRLYQNGERVMDARLASADRNGKLTPVQEGADELKALIDAFANATMPTVGTPHELADRMAAIARLLRNTISEALKQEDKDQGSLHQQMSAFQQVLLSDLDEGQFADMYAQTICYGLFAARCQHKESEEPFNRKSAVWEIPQTNPFLQEMFEHIAGTKLDDRLTWAVDHLAELLARSDMHAILEDFGRRTRREDPVVHFYETFLAAYDPTLREKRGVYYTPEPVVSYIVRSVDHILKNDFGLSDGLATTDRITITSDGDKKQEVPKVLILDPAAGTGTFLHGVVDQIHQTVVEGKGMGGAWDSYVSEHLLPRLFGFELLMAPYAVCHLKLAIQLAEYGYSFKSGERLRVYLTNTLQEAGYLEERHYFANAIAKEAESANEVKTQAPVMVVLGNPPYSGHSANDSQWIADLMRGMDKGRDDTPRTTENYFMVDGVPLGERNPKWLNDDYVKFIRFAQWRIDRTGYGVLAFISNHGYLDNPTFRGMRQSLMNTFDDIYVLDLHGNAKKKEKAPDGSKDENVFDIQQGVSIGIFIKKKNGATKQPPNVYHADLWGVREIWGAAEDDSKKLTGGKYLALYDSDTSTTKWEKLDPQRPFYLFKPLNLSTWTEYEKGWKISEAMPVNSVGIVTARDKLTIGWSKDEVWRTVTDFISLPEEDAREKYKLGKDARDWKVGFAQEDAQKSGPQKDLLTPVLYRPFDQRWTYYTGNSRGYICMPRPKVMRHMLAGDNLGLITSRLTKGESFQHAQVSRIITEVICMSPKTSNNGFLFPLYLYPKREQEAQNLFDVADAAKAAENGRERTPNFAKEFIKDFSIRLKMKWIADGQGDLTSSFGPEDVFHYIYAIFHAPAYRERYAEYLKMDFPRVPLISSKKLFRKLCTLGQRLKDLHLMEGDVNTSATFPEGGDNQVDKPRYDQQRERVYINKDQYFGEVPERVWNFHVGGYQVCQKWLKDRKGRKLSFDDISIYQNIVAALDETIDLMSQVDQAIDKNGGWPIQ